MNGDWFLVSLAFKTIDANQHPFEIDLCKTHNNLQLFDWQHFNNEHFIQQRFKSKHLRRE